jgi:agmatine/peptidylarginine deiminase
MPDHEVIAIDSRAAANGGGGVHCLTKEIPAAAR